MFACCMAPAKLFKLINLDSAKMAWPKKHHVISLVGGFKVYKLKAAKRAKKKQNKSKKLQTTAHWVDQFLRAQKNLMQLVSLGHRTSQLAPGSLAMPNKSEFQTLLTCAHVVE